MWQIPFAHPSMKWYIPAWNVFKVQGQEDKFHASIYWQGYWVPWWSDRRKSLWVSTSECNRSCFGHQGIVRVVGWTGVHSLYFLFWYLKRITETWTCVLENAILTKNQFICKNCSNRNRCGNFNTRFRFSHFRHFFLYWNKAHLHTSAVPWAVARPPS